VTAFCGGGTSGPKPNVEPLIVFSSTELGAILQRGGGLWATLALGALGVVTYEATVLCNTDPPPEPAISPAEYQALLELQPPDLLLSAVGKLKDLVTRVVWFDLCECKTIATPPPPTGTLAPPVGVTIADSSSSPCADISTLLNHVGTFPGSDLQADVTRQLFPSLTYRDSSASNANWPVRPIAQIPSNWVSFHLALQWISGSDPNDLGFPVALDTYDANGVLTGLDFVLNSNQLNPFHRFPATGEQPIDRPLMAYFSIISAGQPTGGTAGVTNYQVVTNCTGTPIQPLSCSQDPVLMAILNSILESTNQARADIRTLQRFALPFAYVRGPARSGLTLTGSAALGRSVGLLVDVTTFPAGNKQFVGQPPYIFDLGWVSVLTPDGLIDEMRLTREHTTWLSKLIPSSTIVGWGLRDGVTITITELHAES